MQGRLKLPWLASITTDRALTTIQSESMAAINAQIAGNTDAGSLGLERVPYLAERGKEAVVRSLRLVPAERRDALRASLAPYLKDDR